MAEQKITKIVIQSRKLELQFQLAQYVVMCGSVLLGVFMIMYYSYQIAINSPAQFGTLAKIFEALQLHSVLGYVTTGVAAIAWQYERVGKKRAIRKASKLQALYEKNDPQRSSSGLTDTGDTPSDEE